MIFSSHLADSLWFGDLGSISVGHQGVENEQQPLQLLCRQTCLFPLQLNDIKDLHHTDLHVGSHHHQIQSTQYNSGLEECRK